MRLWPCVTCDHIIINYLMSFYLSIGRENRCSPGTHRKLAFQYKKHIKKQTLHCYYLPHARKFQGEMSHVEQFLERDSEQQLAGRPRWGWEREPATCPWRGLYWLRGYWEAVLNLKMSPVGKEAGNTVQGMLNGLYVAQSLTPEYRAGATGPAGAPGAQAPPPPWLCAPDHPHGGRGFCLYWGHHLLKYSGQSPPNTEKMTGFIQVSWAWRCKVVMWEDARCKTDVFPGCVLMAWTTQPRESHPFGRRGTPLEQRVTSSPCVLEACLLKKLIS